MQDKEYRVEVYNDAKRNEVEGPWSNKTYTLKGARVVGRRTVNAGRGEYFADIVVAASGELVERVVA